MFTEEEKRFITYWEMRRTRKKYGFLQLAVGLPLAVTLVGAIFINFISGWYKRADNLLHSNTSLILVILVAFLFIVAFVVYFTIQHNWDLNEQRYHELLSRKNKS